MLQATDPLSSSLSTATASPSESSEHDTNEAGSLPNPRPSHGGHQRTQAEKKMDRILANRRSARRSRERRKKLQENLETSVAFLSRQNEDLSRENNMLKQELRVLINLVDQMNKQNFPASNPLGTEALLQQVGLAAAANPNPAGANVSAAAAPPSDAGVNRTATMIPNGADGFNGLTPEQVLALSQLLSNQNQQPCYFPS